MRVALPFHVAEIEWDEERATAINRGFNLYPANRASVRCVRMLESRPYGGKSNNPGTLSYVYDGKGGRVFVESFDELMLQLGVERRTACTSGV